MEDFVKRMITERDELKERIDKLEDFISKVKNGDATVSEPELELLESQLEYMKKYYIVLDTRIGFHTTLDDEKETEDESI